MSASRAIQNFRGFRALWWGPRGAAADALTGALHRLGLTLAYLDEIGVDAVAPERDILFVDGDGLFDPALFGRPGLILPAIPVVGVEAPSRLKALADTGATAFLRKPIHPATVYSSLFRLAARADDIAGELSHGEQQWLEIAMALAPNPKLLLLDEPTGGMSPEERRVTGELLLPIKQTCALVIVEHDLDFIKNICDRLTVLDQGRVLGDGTVDEIERDTRVQEIYTSRV